ncbi:ATP-binding cassette domain-containing protein [Nonomuraea sp. M3C6]|uniref:ATP-binding cassette domain-containing protein n=1 Tax=Nonomuraea marmarensis TaxID=3351344 RepID=A0ABW7AI00_9ACTN
MTSEERRPALAVRGLSKSFGGLHALRDVSFDLMPGQVTALVGDNGAGKSTLVKALSGLQPADEGETLIHGEPVTLKSARAAAAVGIETVHQNLALIEHSNVTQNLFLNREIRTRVPVLRQLGWLDHKKMHGDTRDILSELGINISSVRTKIRDLSGGQRQCVAIGRAVAWSREIVMLDEPTAALGVHQTGLVLELVRRLAGRGVAVLMITHNMEHVLQVCDRVLVLRLGRLVTDRPTSEVDGRSLVEYITGLRSDGPAGNVPLKEADTGA